MARRGQGAKYTVVGKNQWQLKLHLRFAKLSYVGGENRSNICKIGLRRFQWYMKSTQVDFANVAATSVAGFLLGSEPRLPINL